MEQIDRELLMSAAKAAGYEVARLDDDQSALLLVGIQQPWNPLIDDGDALRLAVYLGLSLRTMRGFVPECSMSISNRAELESSYFHGSDKYAATRRAIVRTAAEMAVARALVVPNVL